MGHKKHRRRAGKLAALLLFGWLGTAAWAPSADATSTLFNNNCADCHGSGGDAPYATSTCAGCHAHGTHPTSSKNSMNVSATPDSVTYSPGDPMSIAITGGYRSGWVRVQMWDRNCSAGGTCTQANVLVSESFYTSGTTATFPGPVTLETFAPATPGTYTWYAGWYGNEFDASGATFGLWIPDAYNGGHGNELAAFTFTVVAVTPPETNCNDGSDNNGNGLTDCADPDCSGFVGDATTCGVGACTAAGNLLCQDGGQVDNCTPGTPGPEGPFGDVSCSDSIDNDCDGLTDAADPDCAAPPEICNNGTDDNGNGLVDCADPQCDDFVLGDTSCGVGACAATGNQVCQSGVSADTCTPGTPGAEGPFADSNCSDGIDNDCDGLTDAADPDCTAPPETCDNQVDDNGNGLIDCQDPQCADVTFGACDTGKPGVCGAGILTCDGSTAEPACVQDGFAGTEGPFGDASCSDGLDNDCNGQTDAGDAGCQPVPEICDDGIDNSGNGLVDCADPDCNNFVGGSCNTGLPGICAAGTSTCSNGDEFCDQDVAAGTEGPYTSTSCSDGLDNDCDGLTDVNDPDCTVPLEICDNSRDDNGNGLVDCEDPQCAGTGFGACDTGNPGICADGILVCDGSQQGPVCGQDLTAQPEGPGGSLSCGDGLDNDCDGLTDADDPDCEVLPVEICDNQVDDDGNGLVDCQDPACDQVVFGDCDTGNPGECGSGTLTCADDSLIAPVCLQNKEPGTEGPYTSKTCTDGVDNNCDGLTDGDDPGCKAPVCAEGSQPVITEMEYNRGDGKLHIKGRAADGTTLTIVNAETGKILAEGIRVREGKWEAEIRNVGSALRIVRIISSNGCVVEQEVNTGRDDRDSHDNDNHDKHKNRRQWKSSKRLSHD